MKSLTIHNIETDLYEAIKHRSEKNRRSMNQEIKDVLYKQFLKKPEKDDDFKKFLGIWNDRDLKEFENRTSELSKPIPGDWE